MPTAQATVTAKTGPADQMTAVVLAAVTRMDFLPTSSFMRIFYGSNQVADIDMNGVTTFTVSISGGNFTVTIS